MRRALLAGWAAAFGLVAAAPAARAADPDAVDKAIARGVDYLRGAPVLGANEATQPDGVAALNGLSLLECGAAADDKAVRRAADAVRPAAVSMTQTYSLALSILFLDRLGDPADEPLIQSMTVRLLAGQNGGGGWTYDCPGVSEAEARRLQQATLVGRSGPPKDAAEPDKDNPPKRTAKDLPKEIQAQLALLKNSQAQAAVAGLGAFGDNSNTQFATVALWVARRHGLPVDEALARVDRRFRATQNADGGWAYTPAYGSSVVVMGRSSGTMTCAGLLGVAVGQGAKVAAAEDNGKDGPDLEKDRILKKGLEALGTIVGAPADRTNFDASNAPGGGTGRLYYFMWSLERVAVAMDLDTIGGKDWYAWGSDVLLARQAPDGSWAGMYSPQIDTCFALLFLRRANLTRDLSARLKGKVKDPGEVTLRSGGIGGDALVHVGDAKPADANDRPKDKPAGAGEARPPAAEETEGGRMARELTQAEPGRREELLQQYRDGKGVTFTEALAGAIPQMAGDAKKQARDALAERLTRMKADTLSRYFQDQDAEIRRAAALAAAMKGAKTLVPDLIPLLSDAEPAVAHAAHAALKDLTGESLGPAEDEWKAWWKDRDK